VLSKVSLEISKKINLLM